MCVFSLASYLNSYEKLCGILGDFAHLHNIFCGCEIEDENEL